MKCPICDQTLVVSQHTDLIYNCENETSEQQYPHYSCHVRQIEDKLVICQEDFQYFDYMILKLTDIYTGVTYRYLVAQEKGEDPGFAWSLTWEPEQFNDFFPNFNPKDIDFIINKFELLNTFL